MPQIGEREILDVIRAIEAGETGVSKNALWNGWGNDHPVFTTSSGWRFVVFNDMDEWDYFASVNSPDGRAIKGAEINDRMPTLHAYAPWTIDLLKRWGFDEDEARRCLKATFTEGRPRTRL